MSPSRTVLRLGGVLTAAGLTVLFTTATASAHVTAHTTSAVQGGYSTITFQVPTEDPSAGTVKLQVTFPVDNPIASVRARPIVGWKAQVETVTLAKPVKENNSTITKAAKTVTWTADAGTRINPDEFQEFEVSAGPLPDGTDLLVMPAVQTYDSGRMVNWTDQPVAATQQEPEHPAPSLRLRAKSNAIGSTDMASGSDAAATSDEGSTTDTTARWLGGAGLTVGALGLGIGVGAVLRNRRPATPGSAAAEAATSSAEGKSE